MFDKILKICGVWMIILYISYNSNHYKLYTYNKNQYIYYFFKINIYFYLTSKYFYDILLNVERRCSI